MKNQENKGMCEIRERRINQLYLIEQNISSYATARRESKKHLKKQTLKKNKCQSTSLFYHHTKQMQWFSTLVIFDMTTELLALSRIDASIGGSIGESIDSLHESLSFLEKSK